MDSEAKKLVDQARAFVRDNPDVYQHLLHWARGQAASRLPLSAERMNIEVIDSGMLRHGDGRHKSFPHALRAPVLRMLMRDAPEIRPYAQISRSKVDEFFDFIDFDESNKSAIAIVRNNKSEGQPMPQKWLVLAEKPDMAKDIAQALFSHSENFAHRSAIYREGNWQIAALAGHLLSLLEPAEIAPERWGIPWRRGELPVVIHNWPKRPADERKGEKAADLIKLIKAADKIYHAGDPDDEGQLIVDELLLYAGIDPSAEHIKRVYINDSIPKNIQDAFSEARRNAPCVKDGLSAYARQMADMAFGVSESRLATITTGMKFNIGRVLTPTLGLVYRRDKAIESHQQREYFELDVELGDKVKGFVVRLKANKELLKGEKHIFDKNAIEKIAQAVKGARGVAQVKTVRKLCAPPLAYNLALLQQDMSRQFGYSASQTQEATQELRDKFKAITYNRSDCQYLKEKHHEEAALTVTAALVNLNVTGRAVEELDFSFKHKAFDDTKVTTHHGIIPTPLRLDVTKMSERQRNVYRAITLRYAALFLPDAEYAIQTIEIVLPENADSSYLFCRSAKQLKVAGFLQLLGPLDEDKATEENEDTIFVYLKDGSYPASVCKTEILSKKTTPPKPYTEATLLADMVSAAKFIEDKALRQTMLDKDKDKPGEHGGIGTSATRAEIINHLFQYGYCVALGGKIHVSQEGRKLYELVPETISGVELTAKWWLIQERIKSGELSPNALQDSVAEEFCAHKNAYDNQAKLVRPVVGKCPLCGGNVVEYPKSYRCENTRWIKKDDEWVSEGSCKLMIFTSIAGYNLSKKDLEQLLRTGYSSRREGFKTKTGKAFSAVLYLDENAVLKLKDFGPCALRNKSSSTKGAGSSPLKGFGKPRR